MKKEAKVNFRGLKKVEVEWIDSCSSNGWGSKDHHLQGFTYSHCRTTGYVVEQTKTSLSLAQSISDNTRNIAEVMSIPMVAVKKIKVLR